jgi:hypothetical protein
LEQIKEINYSTTFISHSPGLRIWVKQFPTLTPPFPIPGD